MGVVSWMVLVGSVDSLAHVVVIFFYEIYFKTKKKKYFYCFAKNLLFRFCLSVNQRQFYLLSCNVLWAFCVYRKCISWMLER